MREGAAAEEGARSPPGSSFGRKEDNPLACSSQPLASGSRERAHISSDQAVLAETPASRFWIRGKQAIGWDRLGPGGTNAQGLAPAVLTAPVFLLFAPSSMGLTVDRWQEHVT